MRLACDAMCGGLVRWLRVLGVDATYTPGIDDGALVAHALAEDRIVISGDTRLFERKPFADDRLRGLLIPVGLKLHRQVDFVVRELALTSAFPRCTACNGELEPVARADVADVVPARSLLWADEYFRCRACRHVYWNGTHWQRIRAFRAAVAERAAAHPVDVDATASVHAVSPSPPPPSVIPSLPRPSVIPNPSPPTVIPNPPIGG